MSLQIYLKVKKNVDTACKVYIDSGYTQDFQMAIFANVLIDPCRYTCGLVKRHWSMLSAMTCYAGARRHCCGIVSSIVETEV